MPCSNLRDEEPEALEMKSFPVSHSMWSRPFHFMYHAAAYAS